MSSQTAVLKACADLCAGGVKSAEVAIVLGSGLGGLAEQIERAQSIAYGSVTGMPNSGVAGHAGRFVAGDLGGVPVISMQGRVHLYEGHAAGDVVFGVRVMAALGAKVLIVTNAAGGIAPDLPAGSLMLIEDHINLTGHNCLVGAEVEVHGPRFVDMTAAYDRELLALAEQQASSASISARRGVYAGVLGPSYETPAEVRMLRTIGADAVGMSTVLEVIAARQLGMRCLGISCITNAAAGVGEDVLSHDDVQLVANAAGAQLQTLVTSVVTTLGGTP